MSSCLCTNRKRIFSFGIHHVVKISCLTMTTSMTSSTAPSSVTTAVSTSTVTVSVTTRSTTTAIPLDGWTLISQGAEARIWKIPNYFPNNMFAIGKERFRKSYRHPVLDTKLNKQRCHLEAKCMAKGRKGGVLTPTIYGVHPPMLYMEYIPGQTVREWLEQQQQQQQNQSPYIYDSSLATRMGRIVATLHNTGTIHGDLTTSNMMLCHNDNHNDDHEVEEDSLYLIDFGLARGSTNPEELAVDLYVLERAISSTHPQLQETTFLEDIMTEYKAVCHKSDAVLQRLSQVRLRGRKRECFG